MIRNDRRQPGPARVPVMGERRRGDRRQLPRSRWRQGPSLLASAALGVVAAVLLQSLGGAAPAPVVMAAPVEVAAAMEEVVAPVAAPEGFSLGEAAALREAAQRLTPAAVALDEQARLYWTPLRPGLDAAAADPATAEPVRAELEATRSALARLGL